MVELYERMIQQQREMIEKLERLIEKKKDYGCFFTDRILRVNKLKNCLLF